MPLLAALPRARAAAALAGVDVQPRDAWGADLRPTGALSQEAPGDVRFLLVHHTASSNAYLAGDVPNILRGIYGFHTTDKGWPDIAYNFLIDRFGRVWEGRTGSLNGPVKGDATGGSQGFALLACFLGDHSSEPPTRPALDAMGKLLAALASWYAIDVRPGATTSFTSRGSSRYPAGTFVTTSTIAGHRDMSLTTCPGDACYPLLSTLVPSSGHRLDLFRRGSDSALWYKTWNGAWTRWDSLGGQLTAEPGAARWGDDRADVYVKGADNGLWHKWRNGSWSGWESLGGTLTSAPAATSWGPDLLDVFVRGTDNGLWHKRWNGSWSGWEGLGGSLTSGPGAASTGSDRLDVFVRGTDNALWHKGLNGSWSGWQSLGGILASEPAVASWGPGRLDVFVRGADDALWRKQWDGSWSDWESLGGVLTSAPVASSWGPNRLDVFVRGTDNAVWHRCWEGGWASWESLGPVP